MDRAELAGWLRLSLTPGIGDGTARRLLAAFGLAWLVSEPLTGIRFVTWDKGFGERIPVLLPIAFAALAWLHGRGRYTQRQPFWAETKDLRAVSARASLGGVVGRAHV